MREQIEKTRRSQEEHQQKKKAFLRHDVDFRLNAFAPAFHAEIRWHVSVNVPFDFDPKNVHPTWFPLLIPPSNQRKGKNWKLLFRLRFVFLCRYTYTFFWPLNFIFFFHIPSRFFDFEIFCRYLREYKRVCATRLPPPPPPDKIFFCLSTYTNVVFLDPFFGTGKVFFC